MVVYFKSYYSEFFYQGCTNLYDTDRIDLFVSGKCTFFLQIIPHFLKAKDIEGDAKKIGQGPNIATSKKSTIFVLFS